MKIEGQCLRERLADAKALGTELGRKTLEAFEFAQNAAECWTVSGTDARRAILSRALLKRSLIAISLETTKRKPFDVLVEGPALEKSRGDKTAIGLFLAGVRGWEGGLQRRLDDATPNAT